MKLFGTDGVRGEANVVLTAELAYQLGRAAAFVLKRDGLPDKESAMVIGKDTRISGDMLEASLIAGICSTGVNVYQAGVIPTPAVAVLTRMLNCMAGVVISASHNPYQDNGIKFFSPLGTKLPDEMERAIEEVIENGLKYAKSKEWNTHYKSIAGGADTIGNGYILKGQDTLYLQKFNVDGSFNKLYTHQYMTHILAPSSEAINMSKAYTQDMKNQMKIRYY